VSKKILIVEDEKDLVFLMHQALETAGYKIAEAFNGKEALIEARKEKPDLIIMDIMMPEVDGYTATQEIRKDEALKAIPILISTAKGQMRPMFTNDAKVEGYLEKPFTLKVLLGEVKQLIGE
jgi:CheY-like chemotaxis protein